MTDEFELQLTKMGDKARNWMTMFQNWSTKDEIGTSIRTFQSVRDEIGNTFFNEWRGDKMGGKTYNIVMALSLCSLRLGHNDPYERRTNDFWPLRKWTKIVRTTFVRVIVTKALPGTLNTISSVESLMKYSVFSWLHESIIWTGAFVFMSIWTLPALFVVTDIGE